MLLFSYLLLIDPRLFAALTQEDRGAEYLTAALFMLTSVLLFFTAAAERSLWRRRVYVLGGIVMVFAAGEEISWGQRILGFATPDFLIGVNYQNEFNVHNINILHRRFEEIYQYGTLLLCAITFAASFFRKDRLFGIPLPSILLVLCFLLLLSVDRTAVFGRTPGFISFTDKGLLLLFAIYTLLSRKSRLFIPAAASLALLIAVSYINYRGVGLGYRINEVQEYLFGVVCLFYALELLLAQGAARRRLAALFGGVSAMCMRTGIALPFRRKRPPAASPSMGFLPSPILAICFFVIVCGIGLALLQYFNDRVEAATIETAYRSIATGAYGEPAIRSKFDVYLTNDRLIYYKEECTLKDMRGTFFLRITPVSVYALPDDRGQYGLGTQDFYLDWYGWRFDGKCLGSVPLPEYPIALINTGQHDYSERRWDVSIVVNSGALEALHESIVSGEPAARSTFNIYLVENTLTYTKQPCAPADTEAQFFLHIIPASRGDLPISRWLYGYDNLDFDFHNRGVMFDGKCIATIPLPEYDIDYIRTGQFIPDEGQIWKVEFSSSSSAKDAAIEERYQSIVSGEFGEATARSTFDVYLAENTITYTKQPCAADDVEARFFLHIIPADMDDLPDDRKQSRFDNLDFSFNGYLGNGICIITRSLPEYAINRITTGQYIPDEGQLWKAEFPFTE